MSITADSFLQNVAQMLSYSPEIGSKEMITNECTGCGIGCFSCNNTDECIPQRKNCDGMVDCSNGFDEWNCGKSYLILAKDVINLFKYLCCLLCTC